MDEVEVLNNLRNAKYLNRQIRIEAQLNGITYEDVFSLAARHGIVTDTLKLQAHPSINYARVKAYYNKGYNDAEIAQNAGCAACTVSRWRQKNKLPSNVTKQPFIKERRCYSLIRRALA